jgi:serine/threonine-protein kinase
MILALDTGGPSGSSSIREATPLVKTSAGETNGTISPDGEWLAYQSNESGSWDIYVKPFADPNGARSILSTGGGTSPRWSKDGRELYYVSPRQEMMRVQVRKGAQWSPGRPEVLFDGSRYLLDDQARPYLMYDVAKDGRFLLVKPVAGQQAPDTRTNLIVVLNWFQELKRLVPAN